MSFWELVRYINHTYEFSLVKLRKLCALKREITAHMYIGPWLFATMTYNISYFWLAVISSFFPFTIWKNMVYLLIFAWTWIVHTVISSTISHLRLKHGYCNMNCSKIQTIKLKSLNYLRSATLISCCHCTL